MSISKTLSVLAFLVASPAWAQFSIGPVAGVALSSITESDSGVSLSFDNKAGFAGGVSSEISLSSLFFLQPEVLYISKGASFSRPASDGIPAADLRLNMKYVEVPVLLKAKATLGAGSTALYALFGPSFGFNVDNTASIDGVDQNITDEDIRSFEFSLHGGVGLESKFTDAFTGFFDIRYLYGLSSVAKSSPTSTATVKSRSWLFLVGGRFDL